MYVVLYRFNHRFQEFLIASKFSWNATCNNIRTGQTPSEHEGVATVTKTRSYYQALNNCFSHILKGKGSLNCQIF